MVNENENEKVVSKLAIEEGKDYYTYQTLFSKLIDCFHYVTENKLIFCIFILLTNITILIEKRKLAAVFITIILRNTL